MVKDKVKDLRDTKESDGEIETLKIDIWEGIRIGTWLNELWLVEVDKGGD